MVASVPKPGYKMKLTIGVLALQGAFSKHQHMIQVLGINCVEVRKPQHLQECDALIIPGGESTAMMNRIAFIGLTEPLHQFSLQKPIFGTCAGLILMAKEINNHHITPFGWLDITVERNGFGRQIESFDTEIFWLPEQPQQVRARFIRAPRILNVGEEVKVLAEFKGEPVCIQHGKFLASTFHPELTGDLTLHRYFLEMVEV